MLSQLPVEFMSPEREEGGGGSWSFLQACIRKDKVQWGEHHNMEILFVLGIAAGFVQCQLPKKDWVALPGGVPYYVIN